MKRQYFQTLYHVGNATKKERADSKKHGGSGHLAGLTHCGRNKYGERVYRIFLRGTQPDSEFADTFYHENTHLLLHLFGIRLPKKREEHICIWIGYMVKTMLNGLLGPKYLKAVRKK